MGPIFGPGDREKGPWLLISQTIIFNINKNPLLIKSIIPPFGAPIYNWVSHLHRGDVKTNANRGRYVFGE